MRDHALVGRCYAAQGGKNPGRNCPPVRKRSTLESAENWTAFLLMLPDEFAHLVDGPKTIQIAFALRVAPGEKAMAAEQNTVAPGIVFDRLLKLKS